jgi:uncharacterized protein
VPATDLPAMKPLILLLAGVLGVVPARAADPAAATPVYPPFVLGNTQLRPLPRSAHGRDYLLYVALPYSYGSEPQKKYPVVYMCDGYWNFTTLNGLYGSLIYDRVVPEFIIVGLGYAGDHPDYGKLRQWELVPASARSPDGHAAEFLDSLKREIIPFVEREYRADPAHRVIGGGSAGGLFTLFALFTEPDLFSGYLAVSPSVGPVAAYEEAFARSKRAVHARLYMTGGGNEWPAYLAAIRQFDNLLAGRRYAGLAYQFRVIDGERHGGTFAEAVNRGLRFVFEPLAPETGPLKD